MLGRHLAVLLNNATLIGALGSATRNLQELFDHMRQAIVAFDATGAVGSISSRQAKTLFQRDDLQGCAVRDLLYPGAPSYDVDAASFGEWLEMVFTTPAEEWPSCERYAPREVTLVRAGGESIPLELEFRPLVRGSTIAQLMLLATDVSLARKLEKAVQTDEAAHARRLTAMRSLIAGGTQAFLGFVESVRSRLDRCDAVLREHPAVLPIGAIDELFRQAHTVRGEARAFDLVELESAVQELEEDLDELRRTARGRGRVLTESVLARLQSGLGLARKALEEGCEVLVAASPAGRAVFDQVTVQRSALHALVEYAGDRSDMLGSLISRLGSVPFGVVAASVIDALPFWAESEGAAVTLKVEPRELMVPEALARVLPGVLGHLVRNAVAHGIEAPEERKAAGKPEHGTICIVAEALATGIHVTVEDDGKGLDVGGVLAAAPAAEGMLATERVFLPGVSTREVPDSLAGYGVGLDAVRRELARIHYDASFGFSPGQWTRITIAPSPLSSVPEEGPVR
jgi:HPt (histidine-containing phosphotransfer) domain-containing protein